MDGSNQRMNTSVTEMNGSNQRMSTSVTRGNERVKSKSEHISDRRK